jgi:hypothetical protein
MAKYDIHDEYGGKIGEVKSSDHDFKQGMAIGAILSILLFATFRVVFWIVRAWVRLGIRYPLVVVPASLGLLLLAGWAYTEPGRQAARLEAGRAASAEARSTSGAQAAIEATKAEASINPMSRFAIELKAPPALLEPRSGETSMFQCIVGIRNLDYRAHSLRATLETEYEYSNETGTKVDTVVEEIHSGARIEFESREMRYFMKFNEPIKVWLKVPAEDITAIKVKGVTLELDDEYRNARSGTRTYSSHGCDYTSAKLDRSD